VTISNKDGKYWVLSQNQHPERFRLTEELHARPFESSVAPIDAFLFAKHTGEGSAEAEFEHLKRFCKQHQLQPPQANCRHYRCQVLGHTVRWERHGEFTNFSLYSHAMGTTPFGSEPPEFFTDWVSATEGTLLVATKLCVRETADYAITEEQCSAFFAKGSTVSANIASQEAQVWTDLKIHDCGYNRILLLNRKLTPSKMGRVMHRLLDISTYRNMALLALPEAQKAARDIAKIDRDLTQLLNQLNVSGSNVSKVSNENSHVKRSVSVSESVKTDTSMLQLLTELSMQIQTLSAKIRYRLSAAEAYYAIVNSRIKELNEVRIEGYQTIGEFLQRRLSPAMRTCVNVDQRLEDLSQRTARAVDLLRTRLDLNLEHQNHALLEAMNKRARIQARLQETVEGLSIAAITYYIIGLISYLAKSSELLNIGIKPEYIVGFSVVPVALMVYFSVRRIKRRILNEKE
jgi:uncharacterized membrane-anchored protein